jgi:hypothetical protein
VINFYCVLSNSFGERLSVVVLWHLWQQANSLLLGRDRISIVTRRRQSTASGVVVAERVAAADRIPVRVHRGPGILASPSASDWTAYPIGVGNHQQPYLDCGRWCI